MTAGLERALRYAKLVQLPNTLFALPFALAGAWIGARGLPDGRVLLGVLVAMVSLRTAAMSFNRLVDRRFDAANPRTAERELPTGQIALWEAWTLVVLGTALFLAACWTLNVWTLALAPLGVLFTFGYSLTKRFTSGSHLVLGAALALAPFGGYLATHGSPASFPWSLAAAVLFWVAGFDVLYSCLDADFDRRAGLHSLPARFGRHGALQLARVFHFLAFAGFVATGWQAHLGLAWWIGLSLAAVAFVAQHVIVRPDDLARVQFAFFQLNAAVSITLFLAAWAAVARP